MEHDIQKKKNETAKHIFNGLSSALKCFFPKDFVMSLALIMQNMTTKMPNYHKIHLGKTKQNCNWC